MRLNQRTVLFVITPIILFSIIMGITDYYYHSDQSLELTINEVIAIGQIASLEMKNPMYNLDVDTLNEKIDSLESQMEIVQVLVLFPDGRILTDGTDEDHDFGVILQDEFLINSIDSDEEQILVENEMIRFSTPIVLNGKIGIIVIDYSLQTLYNQLYGSLWITTGIAVALIGIFVPISIIFSRSITNPIQKIREQFHQISEGKHELDNEKFGIPEIQELHDGIRFMNEKLQDLQKDLIKTERLATIGELSARISHDLRNPLTSINNSMELIKIKNPELIKQNLRYFDIIESSINQMNSEIKNILLQTKIKINKSPVGLFEILDGSINSIKIPDNIKITKTKTDSQILCDVEQMKNVIVNIINNSIQAISDKPGDITILKSQDKHFDKITISDNGSGIPDDSIKMIFEPLYTTKKYGTGLGLVNCKNIVQSHDGKIFAENLASGGAMFTILLPRISPNQEK